MKYKTWLEWINDEAFKVEASVHVRKEDGVIRYQIFTLRFVRPMVALDTKAEVEAFIQGCFFMQNREDGLSE